MAPVIQPLDWSLSFELTCDADDFDAGAMLGQRREKKLFVIYYATKKLDKSRMNYSMMKMEILAIVFAIKKFHPYLLSSKVVVFIKHAKPRLI